jgi:hypothetical protein
MNIIENDKEYMKYLNDKYRNIPNNSRGDLTEEALQAYERYALAQFKFQSEDDIKKERMAAIESLIPGSLDYFHLYFINVIKEKKSMEDFSKQDLEHWKKFDRNFGTTPKFYEIEIQIELIHKM